jgi:hypothetical protein
MRALSPMPVLAARVLSCAPFLRFLHVLNTQPQEERRLFIGGLPLKATERNLMDRFAAFPTLAVTDVYVARVIAGDCECIRTHGHARLVPVSVVYSRHRAGSLALCFAACWRETPPAMTMPMGDCPRARSKRAPIAAARTQAERTCTRVALMITMSSCR